MVSHPTPRDLPVMSDADEDAEGAEGSGDGAAGAVHALLSRPFDVALRECAPLREYLREQGDAGELEQEFREHWHPEAPAELRQVLVELLDPAAAAAAVAATEAFLRDPTQAFHSSDPSTSGPSPSSSPGDEPFQQNPREFSAAAAAREEFFLEDDEEPRSGESREPVDGASVDELLARPFDEALGECEALRRHIEEQEDAAEVREEFRQHWHPGAPSELRQVLEEVLDPAAAAAAARAHAAFVHRVAPMLDGATGPDSILQLLPKARL